MAVPSKKIQAGARPGAIPRQRKPSVRPLSKPSDALTVLVNARGIITYASASILPLLGYTPQEIVGRPVGMLVHPDDRATVQREFRELRRMPGRSLRVAYCLCGKDGSWRWVEGSNTNLLDVPTVGAIVSCFHPLPQWKLTPVVDRREMQASEHVVQFYETDAFLVKAVSQFIKEGLDTGDACIVIATPEHRAQLEQRLQASGLDVAAAITRHEYLSLDAAETLAKFMVDTLPEPARFAEIVGSLVACVSKGQRYVRIFGEMVALLWAEGNQTAAIRLEELWNELRRLTSPFSLFCAYAMSGFAGAENEMPFSEICQKHARVVPAESYAALTDPGERLRTISLLQQKANSLRAEIAERRATEQRTFEALTALLDLAGSLAWTQQEATPPTMRTLAPQLAELGRRVLGCRRVTLTLCDEHTGRLEAMAGGEAGQAPQSQALLDGACLEKVLSSEAMATLQSGASLVVKLPSSALSAATLGGAEALVTPMRIKEHLVGFLISDFGPGAHTFTAPHRRLAEAVAQLAAFVLERERWLAERAATQAKLLALEETTRQMDEFLGVITHELRTPITALKAQIQLARRRVGQEPDEDDTGKAGHAFSPAELLARTEGQLRRLTRLIDDLVDLSRIRANKLELCLELCDVGQVVNEVVENVRMVHPNRLIRFEPPAQPFLVEGDPDRLGQVVLNYLTNALKYAPPDRPITVRVQQEGTRVRVGVQDKGPGIPPEEQERIWELFHRAPGIEIQSGSGIGLGLGLHISKTMIERQSGQVGVDSVAGQGSTFWFTLPLAAPH